MALPIHDVLTVGRRRLERQESEATNELIGWKLLTRGRAGIGDNAWDHYQAAIRALDPEDSTLFHAALDRARRANRCEFPVESGDGIVRALLSQRLHSLVRSRPTPESPRTLSQLVNDVAMARDVLDADLFLALHRQRVGIPTDSATALREASRAIRSLSPWRAHLADRLQILRLRRCRALARRQRLQGGVLRPPSGSGGRRPPDPPHPRWNHGFQEDALVADLLDRYNAVGMRLEERSRTGEKLTMYDVDDAADAQPAWCRDTLQRWHGDLEATIEAFAEADLVLDLLNMALAVGRHRAERGEFPSALADLVPRYLTQLPPLPLDGRIAYSAAPDVAVVSLPMLDPGAEPYAAWYIHAPDRDVE